MRVAGDRQMQSSSTITGVNNPAPVRLDYAVPPATRPVRLPALMGIAATTVFASILVGSTTNVINGAVSETYFMSVMGWRDHVWAWSVLQGALEGFVFGLLLSVVLTTTIAIITRASCEFGTGVRWLLRIVLAAYALWILGGICGAALAASQPRFFQSNFIGVPAERTEMLRYAWVGGSIWGAYVGGPLAIIVALILFRRTWRRMLERESPSRPVS